MKRYLIAVSYTHRDVYKRQVYGTPMESTTYKFAKCLQKRFGMIKGVTDKNYITNSYHVHVTEKIDAFSKLKFESDFQKLSPGGAISYVEDVYKRQVPIHRRPPYNRLDKPCLPGDNRHRHPLLPWQAFFYIHIVLPL